MDHINVIENMELILTIGKQIPLLRCNIFFSSQVWKDHCIPDVHELSYSYTNQDIHRQGFVKYLCIVTCQGMMSQKISKWEFKKQTHWHL